MSMTPRIMRSGIALAFGVAMTNALAGARTAHAELVLITAEEAALPASPDYPMPSDDQEADQQEQPTIAVAQDGTRGGIFPPPEITLLSPRDPSKIRGAFQLRIKFAAFGGAAVDPSSIRIVYLKDPEIDLTERLASHITADGIDAANVVVPAGRHLIQIEASDSEMRTRVEQVEFDVAK